MKDRFKFRAYLKDENIIIDDFFICPDRNSIIKNEFCVDFTSLPAEYKLEDIILMQCTGLKDKNGKLIYEDDILELELNELGVALHSTKKIKNGVVRIPDGMFVAQCFDTKNHCTAICQEHWEKAEIIGNIYENKELLEAN